MSTRAGFGHLLKVVSIAPRITEDHLDSASLLCVSADKLLLLVGRNNAASTDIEEAVKAVTTAKV